MEKRGPASDLLGLAFFLILCFAAAGVGSALTMEHIPTWYAGLRKPSWNPPNSVFGPVWSVLYLLMAVAASMVWRRARWTRAGWIAIGLFMVQLGLNVAWSGLFFAMRRPDFAFVEIVLLWIAILATIVRFFPISRPASFLMVPYLVWVTFAAVLNLTIWRLNA